MSAPAQPPAPMPSLAESSTAVATSTLSPTQPESGSEAAPAQPAQRPVALVTGAAKRLGRAIALELAEHGWDIALHFHRSSEEAHLTATELRDLGARVQLLQTDLAIEAQCRSLIPLAVAALDRVDAVVNSAAIFEYDQAASFSYALLERHMRTNTAPAIVLAQTLAEHIHSRGAHGAVVNLLDQKLWNPNPDFLSYTLSKAALESATVLLAQALAPTVRVAGVAPGLTLNSPWLQGADFDQAHQLSPLRRSSTAKDIAHSVRFILENPAMTGTTLLVDGGQHLMRFGRDFSMMPGTGPASSNA